MTGGIEIMVKKFFRYAFQNYLFVFITTAFLIVYWTECAGLKWAAVRFPAVISIGMAVLIISNLIDCIKDFRAYYAAEKDNEDAWPCDLGLTTDMVIIIGMTVLYVILMNFIGYAVSTFIYTCVMLYKLKLRKPVHMIVYAVIITALLYGIFGIWLHIHFPTGFLF